MSEIDRYWYHPNRTLCGILEDMRRCHETRNFAPLPGLIEEAQIAANRMEAGLDDYHDIRRLVNRKHKLKNLVKGYLKKAEELGIAEQEIKDIVIGE